MPDDNRKAVRSSLTVKIQPAPNPEVVAAIAAALESVSEEGQQETASLRRGRWRLAGLLGHTPETWKEPDRSLWAYSRWES